MNRVFVITGSDSKDQPFTIESSKPLWFDEIDAKLRKRFPGVDPDDIGFAACWVQRPAPKSTRGIVADSRRIARLLKRYLSRKMNGAGGSLHNMTDDGNYTDGDAAFCEEWALERGDFTGARLARLLRLCSKTQRIKAINIAHRIDKAKVI